MATIYKRKQDTGKKRPAWYIGYKDHDGKQRTKKGFTDKKETERLAARLEHEVMLRQRGLIDPEQEKQAERRKTPLAEHLEDFERSLGKTTGKHVRLTMTRVRRVIEDASMEIPSDIDIESVEAVLFEMMEDSEIGHKTYNHYVAAMNQFCTWMVPKRLAVNTLQGIEKLNTEVDVRHPRRALEPTEFQKLLESARSSDVSIQCYTGEERARIYTISYMTGLRRKEIASLTPSSFDLDGTPPTVTVVAACSKHRRKDILPLHEEFVPLLREWLKEIEPAAPIFPKLDIRRTWLMVKKDLERAGIPYQTDEGIADFHAAGRHTHITELLRNGATLPEAMKLARHSDVKMTMKYTHIGINDQHRAVQNLSWEYPGSKSGTIHRHRVTSADSKTAPSRNDETPASNRGCRQKTLPDSDCQGVEAAGIGFRVPNCHEKARFKPFPTCHLRQLLHI